jgi:hypothetical protein
VRWKRGIARILKGLNLSPFTLPFAVISLLLKSSILLSAAGTQVRIFMIGSHSIVLNGTEEQVFTAGILAGYWINDRFV